jgi:hypothetical protein
VAENLGVITPEVEALRKEFGFPGMSLCCNLRLGTILRGLVFGRIITLANWWPIPAGTIMTRRLVGGTVRRERESTRTQKTFAKSAILPGRILDLRMSR